MTTQRIPKNPDKRREWIKYQLAVMGASFASIARAERVSRQCVRKVLDQHYPKMEAAVARVLNRTPKEIWPERYRSDRSAINER